MANKYNDKHKREIMLGRIAALHNAGFTPMEIATAVELPEQTIRSVINKYGSTFERLKQVKA